MSWSKQILVVIFKEQMKEVLFVLRNLDLLMGSHLLLHRIPKSRKIAAFGQKKTIKSPSAPVPYSGKLSKDNYPRKSSNKAIVYGITAKYSPNLQLLSMQWSPGLDVISVAYLITCPSMDLSSPLESLLTFHILQQGFPQGVKKFLFNLVPTRIILCLSLL